MNPWHWGLSAEVGVHFVITDISIQRVQPLISTFEASTEGPLSGLPASRSAKNAQRLVAAPFAGNDS